MTCKTHSLTLRRAVPNRSDTFDRLLHEHRLAKEAALRAQDIEVKPTKLQIKQQQRLQRLQMKDNEAKEKELLIKDKELNKDSLIIKISSPFSNQSLINKVSSSSCTSLINNNHQIKIQSPNTALVNINNNNLQFTSQQQQSPTIKQFTFGNQQQQQLTKLLASTKNNHHQTNVLPSSIQVINQTNQMSNSFTSIYDLSATSTQTPTTMINHYPRPAAICTFNERRLSIFTQSSNKKILSSKLFNRKHDYAYGALSIFCNNHGKASQTKELKTSSSSNSSISSNSNSESNSRFQIYSPFDQKRSCNGLTSSSPSSSSNDTPSSKNFLFTNKNSIVNNNNHNNHN